MNERNVDTKNGLIAGFLKSNREFSGRNALFVNGNYYTYGELTETAARIAVGIDQAEKTRKLLAGFLGYRSLGAYASILGILYSGRGYVPLNPNFPIERIAKIANLTDFDTVVVCEECIPMLPALLPLLHKKLNVIVLDFTSKDRTISHETIYSCIYYSSLPPGVENPLAPEVREHDIAYLLFTSGSTGIPKGVPISHRNASDYLEYTCARYRFNENDRFSQTADMSFDLSILEIFPCWKSGSCLYCLPKSSVMLPAKFIRDHALTVWISVPSVGVFMDRMRMMKPGAFPSLRYCLFDGEPLLATIARKWQIAAGNAIIENLYGPTEATVAITDYRWQGEESLKHCMNGIVPIGRIFKGQSGCVVDENLQVVPKGTKGELCLAGSQLSKGYYNDPVKTEYHFIKIGKDNKPWYRTGDIVMENGDGLLNYLGRVDNQVKILGYRVELQEIDCALRIVTEEELAVSVAWPRNGANAEGVVGFVPKVCKKAAPQIIEECRKILPAYMAPTRIHFVNSIPVNSNGKIDRLSLENVLKKGE
jgi:amino acid adenylation domain-containing protein